MKSDTVVDMKFIDNLRGGRIIVTPLDKPDPNKAQLIFSLPSLLQMEEWLVNKALINFYNALDLGRIKDPEILVEDKQR